MVAHALGVDGAWVAGHGSEALSAPQASAVQALLARRRDGEPVAYLTGRREFRGLDLAVGPHVLIPRPETELVVEQVLRLAAGLRRPRILDLGTGSGAIAVAVAHERPDAEVWATDSSPEALEFARVNARRHRVSVRLAPGAWFDPVDKELFDVIASNPPYVADGDSHLLEGDLRYEPRAALVGGADGLECIRHIADAARHRLRSGGWLVLEHGYDQGPQCVRLLAGLGYVAVHDANDLAGLPRVCSARFDYPSRGR